MMRTLGIDLASQPATTAACAIDWTADSATVAFVEGNVDDRRAVELLRDADVAGIDAPFGWPVPFVELVRNHYGLVAGTEEWTSSRRDALRFRRTDRVVRDRLGRWPLSVSSDLIAIVAMRCAGLLDNLGVVDRSGDGRVVEVYPAVALASWKFRSARYKGARNRMVLAELLGKILGTCPWLETEPSHRARFARSDHAFDALVAALVARAAATGRTERPAEADVALARTEGWIALPLPGSLATLAAVAPSSQE
jgi:predicted nuclease with RNAse H fold